ncbi:MAG TPA: replication-associated recombination protein A [Vulgatibacter sp.]|nr:replication-associated recombination protein A [Vulgatibacter sp.]
MARGKDQQELFGAKEPEVPDDAPLAERMRPRTLDEVVGQEKVVGEGRLLRRAIERDEVPSMILWGPPGSGKTTLARLIARATSSEFVPFSAVLGGVADVRRILAEARKARAAGRRTILFVDEIHRFNKAQQDAFLPHVESGDVTLIGATTENPSFALNAALLSRARVYVLEPLGEDALLELLERAMADEERGLGRAGVEADPDALRHLAQASAGDARRALSALEVAAASAAARPDGRIGLADAEEAIARRALLYDKAGEQHYDLVSAFIKSMRGSDPDAALHYAARMLEAGEDPRFVLRRMVIFAAEDVGLADPRALTVALDAHRAFEFVGWPEGYLPISMAICYLAAAPKSNSALLAYQAAKADVMAKGPLEIPLELRNAPTRLMKDLGYGGGYRYPHDEPGHHVAQDYLPKALVGRVYYQPSDQGWERQIGERIRGLRARVAAARKGRKPPQR